MPVMSQSAAEAILAKRAKMSGSDLPDKFTAGTQLQYPLCKNGKPLDLVFGSQFAFPWLNAEDLVSNEFSGYKPLNVTECKQFDLPDHAFGPEGMIRHGELCLCYGKRAYAEGEKEHYRQRARHLLAGFYEGISRSLEGQVDVASGVKNQRFGSSFEGDNKKGKE